MMVYALSVMSIRPPKNKELKMKDNRKGGDGLLKNAGLKKPVWGDDPETIEMMKSLAKMSKVKYDELIRQGFSESQALELCKNLMSMNV